MSSTPSCPNRHYNSNNKDKTILKSITKQYEWSCICYITHDIILDDYYRGHLKSSTSNFYRHNTSLTDIKAKEL